MNKKVIAKVESDDEYKFELLFRKYYVRLCGFANKFICDRAEAEEIVQEVFLNVWKKRGQLMLNEEIGPYLFRSVRNLCINMVEHKKVVDSYYAVIMQVYQYSSEKFNTYDPVLYAELQQKVDVAVGSLPVECGKIFRMSRLEGMKYTEIAEKFGISVKTVETQMSRALAKLRAELIDFLIIVIVGILLNS